MEEISIPVDYCKNLAMKKLNLPKCTVTDSKLEPLSEHKCGFLGEHWILKITIEESIEVLRFFVKSEPATEMQRKFSDATGVFFKENGFYHKIVPEFKKCGIEEIADVIPVSYAYDKPQVLIFEDLSTKGYKMLDARESLPLEVVESSLATFAKFHGSSLVFEEKMRLKNGESRSIYEQFPMELQESFYCEEKLSVALVESTAKAIPIEIDLFPEIYVQDREHFKSFVVNIWKNVAEYAKPSKKFRNVICQGDPWITNLMYKIEDNQPIQSKLIDYQMIRYSPPSQDVITFLYMCTDRKFRRNYLKQCLKYYYSTLVDVLKKYNVTESILSEEEYWESVEHYRPFAMAQNLSHSHVTKLTPVAIKKFFENPLVMKKFIFEDKSETLINLCDNNPSYKEKQKECILDFMELYERKGNLFYS